MTQAPAIAADSDSLAKLVEELAACLKAGEAVELPDYLAAHPEHAAKLQQLYPAIRLMADLSQSGSARVPPPVGDADPLLPLGELGDYQLVRELGRGGMGIVYEAEQRSLRRRVALKVLPFAGALDARRLQRFQNEAQAAASLHHPHIVPVHGVGCERAVHFYAMQYIEGQSLAAILRALRQNAGLIPDDEEEPAAPAAERVQMPQAGDDQALTTPYVPSPPEVSPASAETTPRAGLSTEQSIQSAAYFRTVAGLGIQAAEAQEHAHETGVIHRDIKPANLLVDSRGKLWVTDFGLAQCKHQAGLTMSGDLLGTLRYMSPEQALAQRVGIDHRTDIYSLGATLYELLSLRPVFAGSNRQELLRQIAFEEPRPLRQHNRAIPAELETIVQKALEKNPADRYATAQALADDLRRWLEDKPIRARRPGVLQRLRKWGQRHRAAVASALAVGTLALAGILLGLVWHNRQLGEAAERERDLSTQARGEAERAEGLAAKAQREKERAEALNKFLLEDLLGQASPEQNPRQKKVTVDEILDKAAGKVEKAFPGRPELEAAVRLAIGLTYYQLGLYDRAQPQLGRALALSKERLGAEHPDTLVAANGVAKLLWAQGKLAEAEPLYRQNLEARRRVLGPHHPDTLVAVHNLAALLRDRGKLAEAEPLCRQNLEARRRVLGPDHRETLQAVCNLANLLVDQRNLTEAEPLRRQNVEDNRRVLGPNHPDTLIAVNNLAGLLELQGKLTEAEPLWRQNVEDTRRVLGPDHRLTLGAVNNLALLLQDQGKPEEAEPLLRQNLEASRRLLGPDHPNTLTAVQSLADLLRGQGKLTEAEPLYRQNLEACRRVLGPGHLQTLLTVNNLAWLLQDQDKLTEAEPLRRQNLEASRRALGPDHPLTLVAVNNLARLLQDQGKLAEAEPLFRQNLEARRRMQGSDHSETLGAEQRLAVVLRDQGKLAEAEPLLRQNLEAHRRVLGPDNPNTPNAANQVAGLLMVQDKLAEAVPLLRQNLEDSRRVLGPDHPDTLTAMICLADLLLQQGQPGEAERLARDALVRSRKHLPAQHWELPNSLTLLGDLLTTTGRAKEAEPLLREAVDRWHKQRPPGHPTPAHAQSLLGACLAAQQQYAEAEPLLLGGYRDLEKYPFTSPRERARAGARLVRLYEAWGKKGQADAWRKKLPAGQAASKTIKPANGEGRPAAPNRAPR